MSVVRLKENKPKHNNRISTVLMAFALTIGSVFAQGLTSEEKKDAIESLKASQSELLTTIKGLKQ